MLTHPLLRGLDEDVDDLTAEQPIDSFLTLNGGLKCEFSGSCQYGQQQIICGEPSDLKQARCVCMSGTFQCYKLEEEVASRRAACGE